MNVVCSINACENCRSIVLEIVFNFSVLKCVYIIRYVYKSVFNCKVVVAQGHKRVTVNAAVVGSIPIRDSGNI